MQQGRLNMAEQEKPQGPKRRSSRKAARAAASGAVATNAGGTKPARPPRHHVGAGAPGGGERAAGSKPAPSGSPAEPRAKGWMADLSRYLKSVRTEFNRVTWPTRQELKVATMVVVATLFVLTLYLFVVNVAFSAIFSRLAPG
jgi:preprotein translocase subunit SecE